MKRAAWTWPLVIVALLVGGVGANVALLVIATGDPSFAVEKDYYRKALAWDARMAQDRRNAELGWRLAVTLARESDMPGGARMVATLHDALGAPLAGARVTVDALHNARAGDVRHAALVDVGGGRYAATMPLARPGVWELRVRVERGAHVFTETLTEELGAS